MQQQFYLKIIKLREYEKIHINGVSASLKMDLFKIKRFINKCIKND